MVIIYNELSESFRVVGVFHAPVLITEDMVECSKRIWAEDDLNCHICGSIGIIMYGLYCRKQTYSARAVNTSLEGICVWKGGSWPWPDWPFLRPTLL
jgi:hypothetical protein